MKLESYTCDKCNKTIAKKNNYIGAYAIQNLGHFANNPDVWTSWHNHERLPNKRDLCSDCAQLFVTHIETFFTS